MYNRSNKTYTNIDEAKRKKLLYASFVLLGISLVIRLTELSEFISKVLHLNNYVTALAFDFFPSVAIVIIIFCVAFFRKEGSATGVKPWRIFFALLYLCIVISFVITGFFVSIGRLYFIVLFSITILPLIVLGRGNNTIQNIYDAFADGFIDVGYVVWIFSLILQPFLISGYTGIFSNRNSYGEFNALLFGLFLYKAVIDESTYPAHKLRKMVQLKLFTGLASSISMVLFSFSRTALLMVVVQIFLTIIFIVKHYASYRGGVAKRCCALVFSIIVVPVLLMIQLNSVTYPLYSNNFVLHNGYKTFQNFLKTETKEDNSNEGMPKEDITIKTKISKVTPEILLSGYLGRLSIGEDVNNYTNIETEEFTGRENGREASNTENKPTRKDFLNESSLLYKLLTNSKMVSITTKRSLIWYAYFQEVELLGHRKTYLYIPRYAKEYSGTAHNVVLQIAFDGGFFAGLSMFLVIGVSFLISVKKAFFERGNKELKTRFFMVAAILIFMISGLTGSEYSPFSSGISLAYYLALIGVIE